MWGSYDRARGGEGLGGARGNTTVSTLPKKNKGGKKKYREMKNEEQKMKQTLLFYYNGSRGYIDL